MKSFLVSFLFLCPLILPAQSLFDRWENDDTSRHVIAIQSTFESNASTLPNSMLAGLLWGGYLDANYLGETKDKLKSSGNRFGFQLNNQAYYQWRSARYEWVIGLKYRELFGLKFSKDLFGLAFLGNGPYEGKDANISDTRLGYWSYTGISVGMIKPITTNSNLYLGFSVLYGLNHQSLTTKDAHIYTAVDGEYINTRGDIKVGYKEPGYGLGLALNSTYKFQKGKSTFFLDLQDFGFMQFQKFTTYEGHSDFRYQGTYVNNVNHFTGDSLFSDFTANGLAKKFNVTQTSKSKTVLTPFIISGYFSRKLNDKWRASLDVYYTYIPAYIPKVSGRIFRSLNRNWNVSVGLSYGGFGNQNLLLGFKKDFKRNWSFQMETYFLGIALAPRNTKGGFGLSAGIRKGF